MYIIYICEALENKVAINNKYFSWEENMAISGNLLAPYYGPYESCLHVYIKNAYLPNIKLYSYHRSLISYSNSSLKFIE